MYWKSSFLFLFLLYSVPEPCSSSRIRYLQARVAVLTDQYALLKKEIEQLKVGKGERKKEVDKEMKRVEDTCVKQKYSLEEVRKRSSKLSTYCALLSSDICGQCVCLDDRTTPRNFYCDCQHLDAKRDCLEHHKSGNRVSGMYTIHMNDNRKKIQVYCDQETDNGGWTVIQRRIDGIMNFYRNWDMYKNGFGKPHREFWIGNDIIHTLTVQSEPEGTELRVDMSDWNETSLYAKYSTFKLDGWNKQYAVGVSGYSGTAGDALSVANYEKFSTYDQDNDDAIADCSKTYRGAWWYKHCHDSNLNGEYIWHDQKQPGFARGIIWVTFQNKGYGYSLKYVEMKLRRKG